MDARGGAARGGTVGRERAVSRSAGHTVAAPDVPSDEVRHISVVIPMRNEERRIAHVLEDVAAQDFQGELEVLVADGRSTDRSLERLRAAAAQIGLPVMVIDNPERVVAAGLNACIRRAKGDLIVRLDCKSRYPRDYLRRLAETAELTGAWNVGGVLAPEGETTVARAVATAMDGPFGGMGWSRDDKSSAPVEVDTVYCGAFRPEAFIRTGSFDASVRDDHDEDFNLRLRRAGGRVVLDPNVRVSYRPPDSLAAVFGRYFAYGRWKIPLMLKHRQVVSARSLAPIVFVGSLSILAAGGVRSRSLRRLLAAEAGIYVLAATAFGAASIRRRREPSRHLPLVVAAFTTFHVGYGTGMLWGLARTLPLPGKTRRPPR